MTDPTSAPDADGADLPELASAVLDLVDAVPPGRATTYGDLAELVGRGGPRQPAGVMARYGSLTTWWRVVRADGSLPAHLADEALAHWRAEGTATRETSRGVVVDLRRARWGGPDAPVGGAGARARGGADAERAAAEAALEALDRPGRRR